MIMDELLFVSFLNIFSSELSCSVLPLQTAICKLDFCETKKVLSAIKGLGRAETTKSLSLFTKYSHYWSLISFVWQMVANSCQQVCLNKDASEGRDYNRIAERDLSDFVHQWCRLKKKFRCRQTDKQISLHWKVS